MFVFTQKLLNRDALQRILHCWPFDKRLWRHKLYLVTTQIQRGRLYDSATWPPSLEQPSPAHHQRGQPFCERRCLFVIFCSCCCCCCCCCWWWCCCCCNPIICADIRGTAPAPLVSVSPPPATPKTHSASVVAPPTEVHRSAFLGTTLTGSSPERSDVLWTTLPVCNFVVVVVVVVVVVAVVAVVVVVVVVVVVAIPSSVRPQTHRFLAARPGIPTSGHTQDSFRIVAPPTEVHRKWRQVVGGLPFEGDTALLLSHFGGVHWCLFWFNKRRASPLCPILTTVLGKLRSQNGWALTPTPESRSPLRPSANPPVWRWRLWSELPQARKEAGTPRLRPPRSRDGMKGYSK